MPSFTDDLIFMGPINRPAGLMPNRLIELAIALTADQLNLDCIRRIDDLPTQNHASFEFSPIASPNVQYCGG